MKRVSDYNKARAEKKSKARYILISYHATYYFGGNLGSPRDNTLTSPRNHTFTSPRPVIPSPHLDFLTHIFIPSPHLGSHTLASSRLFSLCCHTITSPRL